MKPAPFLKGALFLALCTCAAADEVLAPEEGQEIHIAFDEPVVSQSAVMNGCNAPPADRGLDLFDVTGDASHPPDACWNAQDRLTISFPEGTSCHTEYRLSFKPGSAHYLSRKEMPQGEFSFHCPREKLEGCGVPEMPGGAVLVFPEDGWTAEARSFSPKSAVRYAFRLAADGETREVAGEATPAQLKHGLPNELLQRMAAGGTVDWASLGPESPLPGAVLVRPTQPLEAGKDWQLICSGSEDFRESAISADFPQRELGTYVRQRFRDGDLQPQLLVGFSAPIPAVEALRLFRSMRISAGDAVAQLSEDGMSQSLMVEGKEYRFSWEPLPKANGSPWRAVPLPEPRGCPSPDDGSPARRSISYQPQGQINSFTIAVDAPQPLTVDITLPAGTRAVLGLEQAEDHTHRLTLNPAWPVLDDGGELRLCSLPLKGEHKVRLRSVNMESLTATLYRLPHDRALQALQAMPVFQEANKASAQLAKARYQLALLQAQRALGFPVKDEEREKAAKLVDSRCAVWKNAESILAGMLAGAQAAAPKPVNLPQGASLYHAAEWVLDVDELAGKPALPGLYAIRLDSVPAPKGKELGLPEEALCQTTYCLLQVSDLELTASGPLLLVTRLSDGSAVKEGEARFLPGENKLLGPSRPQPVPFADGLADFRSVSGEGLVQVIAGDDSCLCPSYVPLQDKGKQLRASLVTERNLYRPGETVHVRGVLRAVGARGEVFLPDIRRAVLAVHKPNGEVLLSRRLPLDSYGAFATDWTLPMGEEDVAGPYRMVVTAGSFIHRETISCQVFRRDAFTAEARLEMNPVAPRSFAVTVRAQDYNGVPLAGGKAELRITASMPVGTGGSSPMPADGKERNIQLALGEDGTAALEGQLGALGEEGGFLSLSGSVANDRGEYVKLPDVQASCFPADFAIRFHDDILCLDHAAAAEASPLPRNQRVHVRLEAERKTPTLLPQGLFILWERETVPVWQGEVEVPAGCRAGVPLALRQHWETFEARHPGAGNATLTISGTDAAGRKTCLQQRYAPFPRPAQPRAHASVQLQDGSLQVSVPLKQGGEAHVILTSPAGARRISQRVQPGHNAFSLPLEEGEEGTLSLCLLLPIPGADGAFRLGEYAEGMVEAPRRRGKLGVSWEMPKTPWRPGGHISLSGHVRHAGNATPAAGASVTLFAVDAGMLAVDSYEPPDWLRLFTACQTHAFRPPYKSGFRLGRQRHARLMEPLWPGVRIHRDGSFNLSSSLERGFFAASLPSGGAVKRRALLAEAAPCMAMEADNEEGMLGIGRAASAPCQPPRVRTNFNPVAFWFPSLLADENGHFAAESDLPDTLASYRVYALVLGKDGSHFGKGETSFTVSQPLMLTPGTPLFMSTGDTLRLPLTVTNNTDEAGVWHVSMPGEATPQSVRLPAHGSTTLYSDCTASAEGDCTLQWSASRADADKKAHGESSDAVAATFPVRFPAPLLKENHHLALHAEEKKPLDLSSLLAPELKDATHGQMQVEMSANPLLHLQGCMDLLLNYPYGCTEQVASGLLAWLLHSRLAPFHARMAAASPQQARQTVAKGITQLLQRQQADGGLSYWSNGQGSCFWASAYAALVLTLAEEEGAPVPPKPLGALRAYLLATYREKEHKEALSPFVRYALGRACSDSTLTASALDDARDEAKGKAEDKGRSQGGWFRTAQSTASLRFLATLRTEQRTEQEVHAAFLAWLRTAGHDYRHSSTWDGGWMLLALHEYLLTLPHRQAPATVRLGDGTELTLGQGPTNLALADVSHPGTLQATSGTAYVTVKAKAQPNETRYPGITEKGLQVTRLYEKKGEDGIWRPASAFQVGDVVRVTLTCAKAGRDLQYFVLEDYLPACMEAINPAVPSQAAGLDWQPWSSWFDHKEFLADRVRGFCTRWGGSRVLNMSYYARVKRAGISTAPPAQAQLMYEPQTYGLSENNVIISQ